MAAGAFWKGTMLTADIVASLFNTLRTHFPAAVVTIRHEGNEYRGILRSVDSTAAISNMGQADNTATGIRLLISELKRPFPKARDPRLDRKKPLQANLQGLFLVRLLSNRL